MSTWQFVHGDGKCYSTQISFLYNPVWNTTLHPIRSSTIPCTSIKKLLWCGKKQGWYRIRHRWITCTDTGTYVPRDSYQTNQGRKQDSSAAFICTCVYHVRRDVRGGVIIETLSVSLAHCDGTLMISLLLNWIDCYINSWVTADLRHDMNHVTSLWYCEALRW